MERLTVKWKPKLYDMFDPIDVADNEYSKINFEKLLTRLGEYEDAEEQGLLLRLPCKVGDTIYVNLPFGNARKTYEREVEGFETCGGIWMIETKNFDYPFSCIGTTAFLTKEEAESALAEKGGAE